jgi:gamma-glutamyl-gamma-aminobutyrate hydrolase PuuD
MAAPGGEVPQIGLTSSVKRAQHGAWNEETALVPMRYVSAVIRNGGWPVLLPPAPVDAQRVVGVLDGLVLTGGPDVDPARYGAAAHAQTGLPGPERDRWEAALCQAALAEDLPLLAICRGVQVLNVARGGTLHQHLPEVVGHSRHQIALGQMERNPVALQPGSATAAILGLQAEALCHHHQAIDRLGRGLVPVGLAGDGTVEAVEVEGKAFALGVQWHPEVNPDDDRLFLALIQAARCYSLDASSRRRRAGLLSPATTRRPVPGSPAVPGPRGGYPATT